MPLPAVLWALVMGHSIWYPSNLLAGFVVSNIPPQALDEFHVNWLAIALAMHVTLTLCFGVLLGVLAPRLPHIPGPVAWGGLVMPVLWTGSCYGLMGVVNPVLQQLVSWPWFVVSQFLFGLAASVVVVRSEQVYIPPAGAGPDRLSEFVTGEEGRRTSAHPSTDDWGVSCPCWLSWQRVAAGIRRASRTPRNGRCRRIER